MQWVSGVVAAFEHVEDEGNIDGKDSRLEGRVLSCLGTREAAAGRVASARARYEEREASCAGVGSATIRRARTK